MCTWGRTSSSISLIGNWLKWCIPKPPCASEENWGICFQVSRLLWNKTLSASVAGHMLPLGGKVGVLLHADSWTDKLWTPCVCALILWMSSATTRSSWKDNRELIQEVLEQHPGIWQRYQALPGVIIIPLSVNVMAGNDDGLSMGIYLYITQTPIAKNSLLVVPLWNPFPPKLQRHREKS